MIQMYNPTTREGGDRQVPGTHCLTSCSEFQTSEILCLKRHREVNPEKQHLRSSTDLYTRGKGGDWARRRSVI